MDEAGEGEELDELNETVAAEERVADASELQAIVDDVEEAPFEETRHEYSGVIEDSDADVDVAEYEEAGALFDDPERIALLQGGLDDPDGVDG